MANALDGRTAVVTGGSRGIGRGIVEFLARDGAEVIFCGRSADVGSQVEQELKARGYNVRFIEADMESSDGVAAFAEHVLSQHEVDILVNNVGGAHDPEAGERPFIDIPISDWPLTFMKCTFNAIDLCNRFVPGMQKRGSGRVINISSTAGLEPGTVAADYSAAKAALNTATKGLANSLAFTGVTVNVVAPGPTLTDSLAAFIDFMAQQGGWPETGVAREQRFAREVLPVKTTRLGRPEDIGAMVALLAGPHGDFITGAIMRVDGGFTEAAV